MGPGMTCGHVNMVALALVRSMRRQSCRNLRFPFYVQCNVTSNRPDSCVCIVEISAFSTGVSAMRYIFHTVLLVSIFPELRKSAYVQVGTFQLLFLHGKRFCLVLLW